MQYESERIEYKSQMIDDIYKEVIAFANTDGGVIYIGIVFSFGMMCLFQLSNAVQSVISLVRGDKEPKKKEEGEE